MYCKLNTKADDSEILETKVVLKNREQNWKAGMTKITFSSGKYPQPARSHCQLAISWGCKYVLATALGVFIPKQCLLSSEKVPVLGRTICTHPQKSNHSGKLTF